MIKLCEQLSLADDLKHSFFSEAIKTTSASKHLGQPVDKNFIEQGLSAFENLTDEQFNQLPEEVKPLVLKLIHCSNWGEQLVNDLEILQVKLEERYRGTSFDLPNLYENSPARWSVGGKTAPSDMQATEVAWIDFVSPVHAILMRCNEEVNDVAIMKYFTELQVSDFSDLGNIDDQLQKLIDEQFEIEQKIVVLRGKGIQIAKEELGVGDDSWLMRLVDMPTGKLPKVDDFVSEFSSVMESQFEFLWKARYLQAIFEERYKGANFSLPRLVLPGEAKFTGTCEILGKKPYPMIMILSIQKDGGIHGTLNWPTLSNSVTRFQGSISDGTAKFTETELLSGFGIGLPCEYVAKITERGMIGSATFDGEVAKFEVVATPQK